MQRGLASGRHGDRAVNDVPEKAAHEDGIVCLPDISTVYYSLRARVERAPCRFQSDLWIRRADAPEHEDRHRASFDNLAHRYRITCVGLSLIHISEPTRRYRMSDEG